ncbi:MAG: HD domain-containing protein [Peptococcaceae bacterium]|nr:HD domain-containing protein [Peptococcaceae bacterium]
MKIVGCLLHHDGFIQAINTIENREQTRRFCRHGLDHALDVARISWILVLENHRSFDKETVYLAALLHDIGRSQNDDDHDRASARLAKEWLSDCGAPQNTIDNICAAISAHRQRNAEIDPATANLGELLALADKRSRACFRCAAAADCYWPENLKNATIID